MLELPPKQLSAGVVVVHPGEQRYRLLCLRTYHSWDFPKAEVHGDAEPLDVAMDETRELTGIDDLSMPWGEDHRETLASEDGSVSRYYLAESPTDDVALRVPAGSDAEEDYEYRWVTVDEAEDILPPRLAVVLDWVVRQLSAGRQQQGS
jgi:8-oxo-dGTP pyrophosphatase MutT (NUDIX family)